MTDGFRYRGFLARSTDIWSAPIRAGLRTASVLYAAAIRLRNRRYDRRGPSHDLNVPVISVGNLTVGGTGKTPIVIDLVERLTRLGRRPAVLSRGYKARGGSPNEEHRLIERRCPGVICLSNPDRTSAGRQAVETFGADVVVLDDGFQHRRLARDRDIVLIDATCPFGYGYVLPRGLLREPVDGLRRAHAVVLTRCDQVERADLTRCEDRLRELAPHAVHLKCKHRVIAIERLDGTPIDGGLTGKRVVMSAGIANPRAFAATVSALAPVVVGACWFPDHHHYTSRDIQSLLRADRFPFHDYLVTTEKDAVKLAELREADATAIAVVRVAIDFAKDDGTILQKLLEHGLTRRPV